MRNLFNQRGLTLVELLAVIIILGIIAAIAIPAIGKIIENSKIKAAKGEALIMLEAAQLYFAETQVDYGREYQAATLPNLVEQGYMSDGGYLNSSSFVTNVNPARICAGPLEDSKVKVTFYNATAKEISDSKNDIHVGTQSCGDLNLVPPTN